MSDSLSGVGAPQRPAYLDLNAIADLGKALALAAELGFRDEEVGHANRTGNEVRKAIRAINKWRGGHIPSLRAAYTAGRFTASMARKEALTKHKEVTA